MKFHSLARDWRAYALIATAAIGASFAFRGPRAGAGMALGLVGAGFSVTVLWYMVRLLGRSASEAGRAKFGSALVVIAFFAKLPLYMVLGMAAHAVGGAAPTCFLLGVGVVYFALVGWALAQS